MAVRTDQVQIQVDFITDESRQLAKTLNTTKEYNAQIAISTAKIQEYKKKLDEKNLSEAKRAELTKKVALEELKLADNLRKVAEEGKKVEKLDLTKVAPAQLIQRAKQLEQAIRLIPASHPAFKELNAELARTNQQISNIRNSSKGISLGGGSGPAGGLITKGAGIFAGVAAFVGSISGIISATRETERLFAILKNGVGGNEARALTLFQELRDFAATTPFALNEVVGAFNKLQQRNFNPTIEQLRTMGDIAAASGKSIDQFVEAILDAQTGEFERLKEFGIVARKNGDELNVSFRGQTTTIQNTSDAINGYLLGLGKLPGIMGATDAIAQTVDGALSNLGDNFTTLSATVGKSGGFLLGFIDMLNRIVGAVNNFLTVPLSEKLREQQSEFNALVGVLKNVNTSEQTRNRAIEELQTKYPDYIGNIDLHKATEAQLNKILDDGNAIFTKRIFLQSREEKLLEFARKQIALQEAIFQNEKLLQQARDRPDSQRGFFDATQAEEVKIFQGVLSGYGKTLQRLTEDQKAFNIEQEQFADRFGIDLTAPESPVPNKPAASPTGGPTGKVKKEAEAAAGSLAFLREKISDLQKEIEATPGDSKALAPLIEQLKVAERQLAALEERIREIKNPTVEAPPTAEEIGRQLGVDPARPDDGLDQDARAALVAATNDFIVQDEQDTLSEIDELRVAAGVKELEDEAKRQEELRALREVDEKEKRELGFQAAEAAAGAFFQIQQNRLDQETDAEISALEKQYAARIKAAEGNTAVQEQLQRELEQKKAAIELEAARKRKALALKEAIINGALAVVKALPNIAAAIAAGIAAAAQIAVISSQKFAQGGIAKNGYFGGKPHSEGGTKGYFDDGTVIEVERGEAFAVINKRNAPLLRMLSRVNALGGHGVPFFEKGGIVPRFDFGGLPTVNTTPSSIVQAATPAAPGLPNLDAFVSAIGMFGQIVANFPTEVKSRIVTTEINASQDELARIQAEAAL